MPPLQSTETLHGVMVCIEHYGILITGPAGIGKSSLALDLLAAGHQLIADDIVEVSSTPNHLIARCPATLKGLLHSRELGTIDVALLFGPSSLLEQASLDYVVELTNTRSASITIDPRNDTVDILQQRLPLLRLSTQTPSSLCNRLISWIKIQRLNATGAEKLKQRQQMQMQSSSPQS